MNTIQIVPHKEDLPGAAAEIFLETGRRAVQQRGQFTVALSGGSTPLPLYNRLADPDLRADLPWEKVHFFWGDERAVGKDHPQSNYGQAHAALLAPLNISPAQVHRVRGELEPPTAAQLYQEEILEFFQEMPPRFDLVLLGMGSDGHTASLFPGTSAVKGSGQPDEPWVDAVHVPALGAWRITFTPRLINAAHRILFLVSGQEKARTLHHVLEGSHRPNDYPSQLIQGQATWLIDRDAGSMLQDS